MLRAPALRTEWKEKPASYLSPMGNCERPGAHNFIDGNSRLHRTHVHRGRRIRAPSCGTEDYMTPLSAVGLRGGTRIAYATRNAVLNVAGNSNHYSPVSKFQER